VGHTVLAERFEIVRTGARGGSSEVLEARDKGRRRVAIKVLNGAAASDADLVARFRREARAASSLTSAHLVRVFEVGVTEKNRPYLVMEYLSGRDLAAELGARGPLPVAEAAALLSHACKAMMEAHDAGIVHRDLKPSNCFLAEERGRRVLKVLDFGIAKLSRGGSDGRVTGARELFGSPLYMAPELFRSAKHADARSDVWSLGVIFYEMITGVPPFDGRTPLEVGGTVTRAAHLPASALRADLPRAVDRIIGRALEKEPRDRYRSVSELLAAVEVLLPPEGDVLDLVAAVPQVPGGEADPEATPTRSYPPEPGPHDRITARPPPPAGLPSSPELPATAAAAVRDPMRSTDPHEMGETTRGFGLVHDSSPPRPSREVHRLGRFAWLVPVAAAAAIVVGWFFTRPGAPATQATAAPSSDEPWAVAAEPTSVTSSSAAAVDPRPAAPAAAEAEAPVAAETASATPKSVDAPAKKPQPRHRRPRYQPTGI
jgi:serine/threonine-protein kinase